jgi:metalloendopeptidase OMA1, mitochondrial
MKNLISRFLIICVLGAGLFVITGCSTVPYSGRTRVALMVSETEERQLGLNAWNEIKKKERVSNNQQYNEALTRVGRNLAKAIKQPGFNWEFVVFDSATPNAFCLPGGKVGVYSGLFKYTANDAELASVVGHEIAHAIARHGGERMTNAMIQQGLAKGVELSTENNQLAMTAYGMASNVGAMLPYSRTHEYEADYLGLIFLAKAGYSPREALKFWKKFGALSKISVLEEFFSTHPAGDNRIEELQKKLPEAEKIYQKAPIKRGLGKTY